MLLFAAADRDRHPNFEGVWDYSTATPLERTKEYENRFQFTPAEARDFERKVPEAAISDDDDEKKLNADVVGDLSTADFGRVDPSLRTSIIVNPYDGKRPPRTDAAKARGTMREAVGKAKDDPEAMELSERCLPDVAGPPIIPGAYNNNFRIVQTPTAIVIATEMINEPRVVWMDGRPHPPAAIGKWNGDSLGRWDGETLVIDTTNFADRWAVGGFSASRHVVERLTLVDRNALVYEFRVEDPKTFTAAYEGKYTIRRTSNQIFEFACHEANYSIVNMLRGARAAERRDGRD